MSKADILSFVSLGAIALAVVVFGGYLDPIVQWLNNNSGAVMAFAATVTAGATLVLAGLNWSTWQLYELERDRVRSTHVRIRDQCSSARSTAERLCNRWQEIQDVEGDPSDEELWEFDYLVDRTHDFLDDLEPKAAGWAQESRVPEATRWLGRIRRTAGHARATLPNEGTDPTEKGFGYWGWLVETPISLIETELGSVVHRLED